eukprot:scaffold55824_cov62-Phaeocystis_antarctica.AAC.2
MHCTVYEQHAQCHLRVTATWAAAETRLDHRPGRVSCSPSHTPCEAYGTPGSCTRAYAALAAATSAGCAARSRSLSDAVGEVEGHHTLRLHRLRLTYYGQTHYGPTHRSAKSTATAL